MRLNATDVRELKDRFMSDGMRNLNAGRTYAILDAIINDIEPRLVVTEPGGGVEWLNAVAVVRTAVKEGQRGIAPSAFDRVASLVEKFLPGGSTDAIRRFDFMIAPGLKRVAEDDWNRAVASAQRDDGKGTAIAAGSAVEAFIADLLLRGSAAELEALRLKLQAVPQVQRRNIPMPNKVNAPVSEWKHAQRLLAVGPHGLGVLSERTHELAHTLRDWRNAVHPEAAAQEPPYTSADGRLAVGLAEKVIEELEAWAKAGATLTWPP